jgi:hypothetical protein
MARERTINVSAASCVLDRLRMGGKKTAIACALVLVMLFMWVRVFIGHRPAAATAASSSSSTPVASAPRNAPVKVRLVELAKVPGRHDSLAKDFFTIHDQARFGRNSAGRYTGTDKEVPVTTLQSAQEVIQRVAQTMKLEAVLWSESPRVFINDHLLAVGDRFTVRNGADVLEFDVLQIYVDAVLVGCSGIQLTLELAQDLEVVK